MDHLCYTCLVVVMLLRLFIAALWLSEGKGLASWLLFVIFIMILLLSQSLSWDLCCTGLYRFLILAVSLTLKVFNCGKYEQKYEICAKLQTFHALFIPYICSNSKNCEMKALIFFYITPAIVKTFESLV